ncbi:pyridoxamine 5'-phosphate oxidase family protein [Ectobacillus antri]|uniref:Pyridoxamine 5'-phosphate oxidase family protein n=1 Tax=Ectobacillus antri TaxID=2486280 RepID=A0ABT6H089_9BACI|nr:pyridoxamine 5'-phosphate oxidase family protein [Ectobacillus antri]MDG4655794.1 pyridoxamine 5'-phosphate oxidase family protein [Ectobacillus antri]MDG5752469.1 pyridoxamine 5'-phosphate oxidase family protein [Ectobacillus antri]
MANAVESTLNDELLYALREERIITVATIDFEKASPNVSAISWVYAMDMATVRFAVDQRSRIVENIRHNPSIVLNIMANESVYSVAGSTRIITDRMEGVPLKLALLEVHIDEVRDVMFYGSKLSTEPKYEKTYDLRAATKLDNQVLTAIKQI